jgi:hypothetical protein
MMFLAGALLFVLALAIAAMTSDLRDAFSNH